MSIDYSKINFGFNVQLFVTIKSSIYPSSCKFLNRAIHDFPNILMKRRRLLQSSPSFADEYVSLSIVTRKFISRRDSGISEDLSRDGHSIKDIPCHLLSEIVLC